MITDVVRIVAARTEHTVYLKYLVTCLQSGEHITNLFCHASASMPIPKARDRFVDQSLQVSPNLASAFDVEKRDVFPPCQESS